MAEAKKKKNWFARTWAKICKFFRELKSELKKVVWPTKEQILKNTLVVAATVLVLGVFIWVFDFVAGLGITGLISLVK